MFTVNETHVTFTASAFLFPGYLWVLFSDGHCHISVVLSSVMKQKNEDNLNHLKTASFGVCSLSKLLHFGFLRLKSQSTAILYPKFQPNIPETTYINTKIQTYWQDPTNLFRQLICVFDLFVFNSGILSSFLKHHQRIFINAQKKFPNVGVHVQTFITQMMKHSAKGSMCRFNLIVVETFSCISLFKWRSWHPRHAGRKSGSWQMF